MKLNLKDILPPMSSWTYLKTKDAQIVILEMENGLKIELTLGDDIFEWFLDIYSRQNQLLINDWCDYYDNTDEVLSKELETDLRELIENITNHKSRVTIERKWPFVYKKFQILKNNLWVDLISKNNIKLF